MRKNVSLTPIETVAQLRNLEVVDANVSKKYVPIYSSSIVEVLEPEFQFAGGLKFLKNGSEHYFDMVNKAGDQIRVYNSFNRSLALRVSLIADGLDIDLGIDRLIHMGQRAKNFNETLGEAKEDIIKNIDTAKLLALKLKTELVTTKMAKGISDIVYEYVLKSEGTYTNYADLLIEREISVTNYIKVTLKNYYSGNYTYTTNDKKKNGQKTDSMLTKLKIENKIMTFLKEEYIEYFL